MLTAQHSIFKFKAGSVAARESLKAYDDWGWLCELELGERADWLRRLRWIKMVDRLAVEEPLPGDAESFANHFILPCDPLELGVTWREAWRAYIEAAHRYRHRPSIANLATHRDMLGELSGNLFCLFPEVDFCTRRAIAHFGALDRFFTQLRDLSQDLRRGVQHFPADLLRRCGLNARDLASHRLRSKPGYSALMRFWLDDYLPLLRREAVDFSRMNELPLGLRLMRKTALRRHARIEGAFREFGLDFERADAAYWLEVDRLRQIGSYEH